MIKQSMQQTIPLDSLRPLRANAAGKWPRKIWNHGDVWSGKVALGNGSQWDFSLSNHLGHIVLTTQTTDAGRTASAIWPEGERATFVAVKAAYGMLAGDAMNVADFINDQMAGLPHQPRQGKYQRSLTSEERQDG